MAALRQVGGRLIDNLRLSTTAGGHQPMPDHKITHAS
jgi:hypothetical protein